MKTKIYSIPCILVITLALLANASMGQDFVKTYEQKYAVDKNATLTIQNKFGDINCQTWSEQSISIRVDVRVETSSQEKANKVFDKVRIQLSGDRSNVMGITEINGSINNTDFSIDYTVMIPGTVNVDLTNRFGGIFFDNTEGNAKITLEYGNMEAQSFNGVENTFDIKFSEVELKSLKNGSINIEYGEWDGGSAGDLRLHSRFSEVTMEKMASLVLDSQYDEVNFESTGKAEVISRFSEIDFGSIEGDFSFDVQYGDLEVERIQANFTSGVVINQFAEVSLGFSASASFRLQAELSFGDLNYPASSSLSHTESGYTTNIYSGTVGNNKSPQSQVTINSKNANVYIEFN